MNAPETTPKPEPLGLTIKRLAGGRRNCWAVCGPDGVEVERCRSHHVAVRIIAELERLVAQEAQ